MITLVAKQTRILIGVIGGLIILGLLYLGPVNLVNIASLTGAPSCGVSSDNVRISSNSNEISGKQWVVELVAGECDHIIEGGATIKQEDLESQDPESGSTVEATTGFQLGFTDLSTQVTNNIQKTSERSVYEAQYTKIEEGDLGSGETIADVCNAWQRRNDASFNDLDVLVVENKGSWVYDEIGHCYRASRVGTVAEFNTQTNYEFDGTFTLSAAGSTKSGTVTEDDSSVTLSNGDRQAHIQWTGNLLGDVLELNIPVSNYRAACDNACDQTFNQISWKLTGERLYEAWRNEAQRFESDARDLIQQQNQDPLSVDNGVDSTANNVFDTTGWTNKLVNRIGRDAESAQIENQKLVVTPTNSVSIGRPQFTVRINADWVGFNIPVAQPEITSASIGQITGNGGEGTARINVRNNAEVGGRVETSVTCPDPLTNDASSRYISAGSSKQFSLNIESGPSNTKTYTCTVRASDTDAKDQPQTETSLTVDVKTSCPDQDGDAVCDQNDACPTEQGPERNNGCPTDSTEDSDNDGIADSDDQCPTPSETPQKIWRQFESSKETYNGYQDSDGCPDSRTGKEICNNGIDDNGNGLIDERDPACQDDSLPLQTIAIVIGAISIVGITVYRWNDIKKVVS